jgi:putative spermidine/putrescine transport system ATP-binding protein
MSLSDRVVVMSEGRVEQIGPPPEIYNFPATPFVASFVGTLNLLPARVVDASAGTVSVAGQTIRTPKAIEAGGDGPVTVALRPEAIEIGEGGGANRLSGQVEDVSFLGSIVRTRIRVADDALVSLDQFNDPALAASTLGETITISFPPEATLVLAGKADATSSIEQAIAEVV